MKNSKSYSGRHPYLCGYFAAIIFAFQLFGGLVLFANPLPANAQTLIKSLDYTPQITIPNSEFNNGSPISAGSYDPATGKMTSDLLGRYIKSFYNYGLTVAAILATLVLMGGGVIWMLSGGDSGKVGQAKELITGSIVGMLILVCAWVILNTINPNLVNLNAVVTPVIKKVTYCCDSAKGNTLMNSDGTCSSGVICDTNSGESCVNTGNNVFGCIAINTVMNEKGEIVKSASAENKNSRFFCCEYKNSRGTLYCSTVATGKSCPGTYTNNSNLTFDYSTSYTSWCRTRETKSNNCLVNECAEADDGDACNSGFCYREICWMGIGKKGEPCGNRSGSKCYDSNNGERCGKNENGQELYRDKNGGRDCGGDLWCCNTNK